MSSFLLGPFLPEIEIFFSITPNVFCPLLYHEFYLFHICVSTLFFFYVVGQSDITSEAGGCKQSANHFFPRHKISLQLHKTISGNVVTVDLWR